MPKVTEEHKERVRTQILDAALRCFLKRGMRSATMADIVAESGLSAGAIYVYFSGKQELAIAAARRVMDGRIGELNAVASQSLVTPGGVLRILGEGVISAGIDPRLVVHLWGEAANDPEVRELVTEVFTAFRTSVSTVLAPWAESKLRLSPRAAKAWAMKNAPLVLSLSQGMLLQRALIDSFDMDAYVASVDALFAR